MLLATLADGVTILQNALFAEDTIIFARALRDLGFEIEMEPQAGLMRVRGENGRIPVMKASLSVGNAGTAARFLTAMLTLGDGVFRIDGSARMCQRPIEGLVLALNELGAQVKPVTLQRRGKVTLPLVVSARGLKGGKTRIQGDVSSQFLSGLLMASPYASTEVEIKLQGTLQSKPYIDLTLKVMKDFSVNVESETFDRFLISPQRYVSPGDYVIEADVSSASYFFAAPAICGGWVEVSKVTHLTRQGDIAFLDVLSKMGCQVTSREDATRVSADGRLRGVEVDMGDFSDTAMTLAAIAPFADSPTRIRGIASSRYKETDRVAAICTELRRLGVLVEERPDGMTIYPSDRILPCRIQTYNDHRMAMAFSLVGLRIPGIEIENPGCVAKTFPGFFEVLDRL
jgi:3-phosphoshikimate 1-carboxyvinyltransferase